MPQRKVFGLDRSIQNHYVSTWEEKTDKVTPVSVELYQVNSAIYNFHKFKHLNINKILYCETYCL